MSDGLILGRKDDWGDTPGIEMTVTGAFVAASVPLRMADLQRKGGPTDLDYELARNFADALAEHGDVLLYGGKPGEAAALANQLAHAVAVLAFQPGGVRIFGYHFVAQSEVQP